MQTLSPMFTKIRKMLFYKSLFYKSNCCTFFWILAYCAAPQTFHEVGVSIYKPELFVYHYRPKNFPMKINQ